MTTRKSAGERAMKRIEDILFVQELNAKTTTKDVLTYKRGIQYGIRKCRDILYAELAADRKRKGVKRGK